MANVPEALSALLRSMADGVAPSAVQVTIFSDMDTATARAVREAWAGIPVEGRRAVLERLGALVEDNIDLDFTELCRIGLDDPDAVVRRRAAEALWESIDRRVAGRLATLVLQDPDESVRGAAARGLGPIVLERELGRMPALEGDQAVEALRVAASPAEASADVRARALEAVATRTLGWVDTLISDAYYHDDRRLRLAAVRAMGVSANEEWMEFLDEQAVSEDPEFRFEAAAAFGAMGAEDGIDPLCTLLADEDAEVVKAALFSLGELGGDVAVERLKEFLESAEGELADLATEALEEASFADDRDLMRKKVGL